MGLIFLTGIAGSGKSTLFKELVRRGHEAIDADEKLSFWVNTASGERVSASDHTLTTDPEFFEEHDWYIDVEAVERLAQEAKNKTIYICGSVANEEQVRHSFEKVYCLFVDEASLTSRIQSRTDKDFGKTEHELAHLLKLNRQVQRKYELMGAVIIDATQPVTVIADRIITDSV